MKVTVIICQYSDPEIGLLVYCGQSYDGAFAKLNADMKSRYCEEDPAFNLPPEIELLAPALDELGWTIHVEVDQYL